MEMYKVSYVVFLKEREGLKFHVEIGFLFDFAGIDRDLSVAFIPHLSDGQGHCLELPLVSVLGGGRYWAFRLAMLWRYRKMLCAYKIKKVLKAASHSRSVYRYRVWVDYEEWMPLSEVGLRCA